MIKNLQRKVKNIFLHKNFKESLYYKNCMAGRKLLLLFFYLFIYYLRTKHRNREDRWFLIRYGKNSSFEIKRQAKNIFPSDVERTVVYMYMTNSLQ